MAHKKAGGSTRLGRDSKAQYLGVKVGDGQTITAGSVLIRQRGTKYHPGENVSKGKDDTLFATISGIVKFKKKNRKKFDGSFKFATFVNVFKSTKKE